MTNRASVLVAVAAVSSYLTTTATRGWIQKISSIVTWKAIVMATAMAILHVTCVGVCEGTPKATSMETGAVAAAVPRGHKRGITGDASHHP
jgi:hypothetical protein